MKKNKLIVLIKLVFVFSILILQNFIIKFLYNDACLDRGGAFSSQDLICLGAENIPIRIELGGVVYGLTFILTAVLIILGLSFSESKKTPTH